MGNLIAAEQSKLEALSSAEGRARLQADAGWLEARYVCPDSLLFQASRESGPAKKVDEAQAKNLGAREVAAGFSPEDEERFSALLNSLIDNQKQLAEACNSRDQVALQEMRSAVTSIHLALYRCRKLLPKVNESLRVDRPLKLKAIALDPKSEKLSGLETLLDLLKKAPSLYTTFTSQAATLFSAIPPMSLSEPVIQPQIDEIVGVLRSIASGEVQISPLAQAKAIPALLSIALGRGDLHCALDALLLLSRLPPQCESPEAVSTLHQALRAFPEVAQLITQQRVEFTWNTGRKGPDIEISRGGLTITRTNSAGWGCNLSEQSITDGVHYVEFNVDKGTSSCLLLGIAGPNFEGYSSKSSCDGGISIQADGDVYVNSNHVGNFFRYTEGDRVGVLIDMESSSLTFYHNGKVQDKSPITPIPKTVHLLSCFGGSEQFVTINNECEPPGDATSLALSTLPGRLLPAKGEDFGKLPADSHALKPQELAAFALSELSRYSLVAREQFGLTEDPRGEVECRRITVSRSILLDLKPETFECLMQLCEVATERLEAQAEQRKTWFWTTVYSLRLLNTHLFASHYAVSQLVNLQPISAMRSSLQFYLLKDWTLVPARKTQLRREIALVISHNAPLLYPTPQDKLDFLAFTCQQFRSPEVEDSSAMLMKAVASRRFMEDFIDCSSPENFQALTAALKLIMDAVVGPIGADFQPFRPHPLILSAVASWQRTLLSKAEENQFAGAWGSLLVDYTVVMAEEALKVLQSLAENCNDTAVLLRGRGTILHKVVPTLFLSLSLCRMPLRMYDALLSPLPELLQSLALIPTFKDFAPAPIVYESAHPFVPTSESKEKTISVVGAHGYELTFDPRCNLGNSFFQVWLDEAKTKKHSQWTGTQFPRDLVTVEHPEVKLMAVDGKREAWGWRVLIVPYGEWRSPDDWVEVLRKAAYTFVTSSAKWLISCDLTPPSLLDTLLFRSGLSDKFECHLTSKPTIDPSIARLSLLSFRVRKQEAMELSLRRGSSLILCKKQGALQDVKQYLGGFKEHANSVCRFSEQKHVDRFVAGGTDVEEVWKILKQEAGAVGPVTTIGGKDLDVAERAVFATYACVFGFADRFGELIEGVDTLGDQVNYLIRQATQFRRWAQTQKQKNPSLTYSALQDSLLPKFLILLRLNHEKLRLALRVRPIVCLTVKSYSKNMSRSMELSRQKSSDVTKASLNIYRVRSLLSVTIPKTTGVDAGLQEEWKAVSGKVYEFLESECSVQDFVQEFSDRRNKALARCIGLNILVDVMKSANRTRTMELLASESFSTSLLSPQGHKQHYLSDLSGIDPLLQRCVQTSFFTLYQSFAACLSLTFCRELDCTGDATAGAFLAVMNALACKLEQRDMEALGTVKLRGMVEFILAWAKGVGIKELGRKKFDISKCITNLTVSSTKKRPKKKEALQLSAKQLLKVTKGGDSAQPIVRLALSAKADAAFGPPKVKIDGKRSLFFLTGVPSPGGKYLTSLSVTSTNPIRFEPQFTPYDNLLIPDESEAETTARKLRKGFLRHSAWGLLKLLTYSLCAHDGGAKSDIQLQQMLLEVLFPDLRWSPSKEAVTTEFSQKTKMHLRRVSRGLLWLEVLLDSTKRPTNAVAEWVKQLEDMSITLLNSEVSDALRQFAQSFLKAVTKFVGLVDPTLSGGVKATAVDPTLRQEMTAFTDAEGTIDFFMYVNAELSAQLSAVHLDTPNLPIYRKVPANLAQARDEVGNATVYGLLSQLILAVNLRNCKKLDSILSWFKAEGKPGRVTDSAVVSAAPAAFLNGDKELDLLTALTAIRKSPEAFSDYWEELKQLSIPWEHYPESCTDLYCAPPQATHLTASLLWAVHQCVRSSSFQLVLAQSPLLPELIKHAFSAASETVSTISFRIVRKLFSASCSVPTVQKLWAATPKDSLTMLVQDAASGDIVKTLLALTGLQASFHLKQKRKLSLSLSAIHQLSGEALECLQCMYLSPVWRTQVVNRVVAVLHSLAGMASSELVDSPALALGALAFISNARSESDCYDTREWTTVELVESAVHSGWVVSVHPAKSHITLFTPDDGQFKQEQLVRVDRTVSSYPIKFFADISSETAEELFALLLGVLRTYQASTELLAESATATLEARATWRQAGFLAVRGLTSLVLDRPNLSESVLQTVSQSLLAVNEARGPEVFNDLTSLKECLYIRSQTNSPGSKPATTPDRQNQLLQEMKEDQQVLVATLLSVGLSFDDIILALDEGQKDVDSIQKWVAEAHEKRPGVISDDSILYKLDDSAVVSIVDHSDTAYFYQLQNSAIVLQADEPCDEEKRLTVDVNSGMMKKYTEFLPEVSVLLAVETQRHCEVALGGLRIQVEASEGGTRVSLGAKALWSGSEKVAEVRVFARFDGRVAIWTPAGTAEVAESHPDIFNGMLLCAIAVVLPAGSMGRVALQGLALYPRRHTGPCQFWPPDDSAMQVDPQFLEVIEKHGNATARCLGFTGTPVELCSEYARRSPVFIDALRELMGRGDRDQWPYDIVREVDVPITDIKTLKPSEVMPEGYQVVPGIAVTPARAALIYKRGEGTAVTGLQYGEGLGKNLEDMALDATDCFPLKLSLATGSNREPVTDLLFVTSSTRRVLLPPGFSLLKHSKKAVNFALKSDPLPLFLAVRSCSLLMSDAAQNFNYLQKVPIHYGLSSEREAAQPRRPPAEQAKEYRNFSKKTTPELFSLSLLMEERAIQDLADKCLYEVAKRHPGVLRNVVGSDASVLLKVLSRLQKNLKDISAAVRAVISSESFSRSIFPELYLWCIASVCTWRASTQSRRLTVESIHPYVDNMRHDEVITIPGAQRLKITFDPLTRTESGCDIIRFYMEPNHQNLIYEKSGTEFPPLEVEGDTVYLFFYTDGSRVDWGYLFTVEGVCPSLDPMVSSRLPSVSTVTWLLSQCVAEKAAAQFTRREFLYPLLLYTYTVVSADSRSEALDAMGQLLALEDAEPRACRSVMAVFAGDMKGLFEGEKRGTVSKLTHTLLNILLTHSEKFALDMREEWFQSLKKAIAFMNGFTQRFEELDPVIFRHFLATKSVSLSRCYEGEHPYRPVTEVTEVSIPGAHRLELTLSPETSFSPLHTFFISLDRDGRVPVSYRTVQSNTVAKWKDAPIGPDIAFSNEGLTITRTNSAGWGCAVWNTDYSVGQHRITFFIDNDGNSEHLVFGVAKRRESELSLSDFLGSIPDTWSWRKNGSVKGPAGEQSVAEAAFATGDVVSLFLDFDNLTITFCKNGMDVHSFPHTGEVLTPMICFGGSNQFVSSLGVESSQPAQGAFSKFTTVTSDTVYCHFPVNVGYATLRGNSWAVPQAVMGMTRSSENYTRVTRTSEPDTCTAIPFSVAFSRGRHYGELEVLSLAESELSFGLAEKGQEWLLEPVLCCSTSGLISALGQTSTCEVFASGDRMGFFANMETCEFAVYKNGAMVRTLTVPLPPGDYNFAVCLKAVGQEVRLVQDPVAPADLYSPDTSEDGWGFHLTAQPEYEGDAIMTRVTDLPEEKMKEWQETRRKFHSMVMRHSETIVQFIDARCSTSGVDPLTSKSLDLTVTPADAIQFGSLSDLSPEDLKLAFDCLTKLNSMVVAVLPFIIPSDRPLEELNTVQRTFLGCKNLVYFGVKNKFFRQAIALTNTDSRESLIVDRTKAMKWKRDGKVDTSLSVSVFSQLCLMTNHKDNTLFRSSERIYRMTFAGEGATDAGGPYNETMSTICDELQSQLVPLLTPTQNNKHGLGEYRDAWIPNPASNTDAHLKHFRYLGKLLGVAVRTQNNLNLAFPPLFWKRLIQDRVTVLDLKGVDEATFHMLEILRDPEKAGLTKDSFADAFNDVTFTYADSSGNTVELLPNGGEVPVTYENAAQYADLVEQLRLNESADIYGELRKGLGVVVPNQLLRLFSWKQTEALVCGAPDIDVDLLMKKTSYSSWSASDRQVQDLWTCLREFTPQQRCMFLRFVWGRSRLPASGDFRNMTINKLSRQQPDSCLPVAHTCSFGFDLAEYSSIDILRSKLLYAITQCQGIDLDGLAGGGWVDDE